MICAKSLVIGAVSAVLSVLVGVGVAHAECDNGSYATAQADMFEGQERGLNCEVIELRNGTFEAQCDDPADEAVQACTWFVEANEEAWDGADGTARAYEDCMTIALHTGAVRQ